MASGTIAHWRIAIFVTALALRVIGAGLRELEGLGVHDMTGTAVSAIAVGLVIHLNMKVGSHLVLEQRIGGCFGKSLGRKALTAFVTQGAEASRLGEDLGIALLRAWPGAKEGVNVTPRGQAGRMASIGRCRFGGGGQSVTNAAVAIWQLFGMALVIEGERATGGSGVLR